MADTPNYADGVLPAGTPTLTFSRLDDDLPTDAWDYQADSREITRQDVYGQESSAKGIMVNPMGSATVQIYDTDSGRILAGDEFTLTDTADTELGTGTGAPGGGPWVFIVKTASSPRAKDEAWKQSITFRRKINASE